MRWTDALRLAQAMGGDMCCVESAAEQAFIAGIEPGKRIWLGGFRQVDGWKWTSNQPFKYTQWERDPKDRSQLRRMGDGAWGTEGVSTKEIDGYLVEWPK